MKCPSCSYPESKVIDSRPSQDNSSTRRRRECLNCGKRFTTYETIETVPIIVIKKDKSRETYDRNKLFSSIIRACDKRTVTQKEMETVVNEIEAFMQNSLQHEIPSSKIGELVMESLKKIDEVAYVRFASVHKQFVDIDDFQRELVKLQKER